jgi:hypothetical protein
LNHNPQPEGIPHQPVSKRPLRSNDCKKSSFGCLMIRTDALE